MKIKFKDINKLLVGLNELLSVKGKVKLNHWAGRWYERLQKESESLNKSRINLAESLCNKKDGKPIMIPLKDDKGEPILQNGQPMSKYDLTPENEEKLNKEYNELLEDEFEVDLKPLPFDDSLDGLLKGAYQTMLNDIIDPEFIKSLET